ncbi:hypothetical protein DM480_11085 [Sphingomonas sp. FARSPH]|nr:hypothetical protein DM480_11085 [Sphingomonas sp. FARSPH]
MRTPPVADRLSRRAVARAIDGERIALCATRRAAAAADVATIVVIGGSCDAIAGGRCRRARRSTSRYRTPLAEAAAAMPPMPRGSPI